MFCPRCGQQAAEEVRFCSRCGLPLDAAAELVEAGGRPEWGPAQTEAGGAAALTPRQRGTRKGLMITIGGLLFFIVVGVLMTIKEDFFPFLILAGLILTVGVMRMLYGLLLEEHKPNGKTLKRVAAAAPDSGAGLERGASQGRELPPARAVPDPLYTRHPADTSDMAASPASITENTTKLLESEP